MPNRLIQCVIKETGEVNKHTVLLFALFSFLVFCCLLFLSVFLFVPCLKVLASSTLFDLWQVIETL